MKLMITLLCCLVLAVSVQSKVGTFITSVKDYVYLLQLGKDKDPKETHEGCRIPYATFMWISEAEIDKSSSLKTRKKKTTNKETFKMEAQDDINKKFVIKENLVAKITDDCKINIDFIDSVPNANILLI